MNNLYYFTSNELNAFKIDLMIILSDLQIDSEMING